LGGREGRRRRAWGGGREDGGGFVVFDFSPRKASQQAIEWYKLKDLKKLRGKGSIFRIFFYRLSLYK
jgi:hypothetical protein